MTLESNLKKAYFTAAHWKLFYLGLDLEADSDSHWHVIAKNYIINVLLLAPFSIPETCSYQKHLQLTK